MVRSQIITRAEGKNICNIRESNDDKNEIVDHLIMVATEQLERATGRFFTEQVMTEYFDTRRTLTAVYDDTCASYSGSFLRQRDFGIRLQGLNVDPVTFDLRYDTERLFADETKLLPESYSLNAETGDVRIFVGTYERQRSIKVVYTAGWTAQSDDTVLLEDGINHPFTLSDTAPFAIKEACLLQVGYLYARRRADNIGLTGDRSHGKADQYVQTLAWGSKMGLAPEAQGLVQSLKKPVMGRY